MESVHLFPILSLFIYLKVSEHYPNCKEVMPSTGFRRTDLIELSDDK